MPAMSRLRDRKRDFIGADPGATSDTTRPCCGDALDQGGVRRRDRDARLRRRARRPSAPSTASAPRWALPSMPKAAPETTVQPRVRQPGGQVGGHLLAVGGGRPRPDDRHRPLHRVAEVERAAHPETPRRELDVVEARGPLLVVGHERAGRRPSPRSRGRARCRGRRPGRRSGRAGPTPSWMRCTVSRARRDGDEPVHLGVARLGSRARGLRAPTGRSGLMPPPPAGAAATGRGRPARARVASPVARSAIVQATRSERS